MAVTKLPAAELVAEVDWLLEGGMTPYMVCDALQKTPAAVYKAAWKMGRKDIAAIFGRKDMTGRQW